MANVVQAALAMLAVLLLIVAAVATAAAGVLAGGWPPEASRAQIDGQRFRAGDREKLLWGSMDHVDDLVSRIASKARAQGPLPDVVTLEQLGRAERILGFGLPRLLAALYTSVADGGFGPGTEIDIPEYNVAILHPLDRMVSMYHENRRSHPAMPYQPWPAGVVPMLNWGGFAEAAVDCMSQDGTVLLYEADVETVAPDRAWKVDARSLAAWWRAWLDGTRSKPTEIWHR
ncbi:MAG: SMI1/KNR4 family protein [Chloroflexi bacterium]|nr:MAG: SMI1/KNR4 family protein [Chloroflexota bacterium]